MVTSGQTELLAKHSVSPSAPTRSIVSFRRRVQIDRLPGKMVKAVDIAPAERSGSVELDGSPLESQTTDVRSVQHFPVFSADSRMKA